MRDRTRLWTAVVLAAAALLTFYRLGAGTLWDQDETKYAEVAREILRTHDPITLHINGRPWYVHPPLYMWLVAGTGRAFGFDTFTVRVWSGIASVLAVYATMLLGRLLFNVRTGVLAGAVLAVTFHFLVQSRLAVFDTVLLAFMLLAAYNVLLGYRRGRPRDYLWFFIYAGLATLTKGPIGLVLPGLVAAAFVSVRRAWSRRREVPWALGIAVYVVIGLGWYAAETALHGGVFVRTVLGYYGLGRFFGVVENQAGPWYYYIPIVLIGAFPWTAFWPAAAAWHTRRLRDDGSLFVVLWCGIVFVFYSLARTKLPNYVLPIYPLAAVGVAALWDALLAGEASLRPRWLTVSAVFLAVLVAALYAGIGHYLARLYPAQYRTFSHVLVEPAAALGIGVALAIVLLLRGRRAVRDPDRPTELDHGRPRGSARVSGGAVRGPDRPTELDRGRPRGSARVSGGAVRDPDRPTELDRGRPRGSARVSGGAVRGPDRPTELDRGRPRGSARESGSAGAFAALCAAMALTWLGIIRWVVPLVEAQKPMPVAARAIAADWRPGDRILGYRLDIYSSLIYYSGHQVRWIYAPLELANDVCRPGRAFVVIAHGERQSVALPKGLTELSDRGGIDVLLKPSALGCP
jgi:4-amino-4-deoxy-L-arabinose transferase-like glycosyltransferase